MQLYWLTVLMYQCHLNTDTQPDRGRRKIKPFTQNRQRATPFSESPGSTHGCPLKLLIGMCSYPHIDSVVCHVMKNITTSSTQVVAQRFTKRKPKYLRAKLLINTLTCVHLLLIEEPQTSLHHSPSTVCILLEIRGMILTPQ